MLRRQLPFLSSPNKRWHPPPTGPRHPRVSITTPAQGLTRPAQILGRTSCGLWSRAALGTPAVGPRACLLPSEGLGFAQAHPSPPSSRARGGARLPLCPSILTPASTRGAQRRGPWAPGPGSRRQTVVGPSVITRSEGKMAPGAQVTWSHSDHPTRSRAGPHPLPTAPLPSMRSGVVTAPTGPWKGDPRPSLPSRQSAAP